MEFFWILTILFFGASIGSFLNVCIYRIPLRKSLIFPGSSCPQCGNKIHPWDNIPILSYLILRGRCRYCKEHISVQYLLVEITTPLLLLFLYIQFRDLPQQDFLLHFLFFSLFVFSLIVIFVIDLYHRIIPDRLTYPGMVLGLLFNGFQFQIVPSLIGLIGGGGFLYIVMTVGRWIYKKEVMGGGDVKLAAMLGSFLGGTGVAVSLFLAFLLGSLAGGLLIVFGRLNRSSFIPFGPFIVLGALITLFWEGNLWVFYNQLFRLP